MINRIDTYGSIFNSPLPESFKDLLFQYCSFLHWIDDVPFPPIEQIINVLEESQMRVRQIVYLYSANETYSLSQYSQPITSTWTPEWHHENIKWPNLFWCILHGSGSLSLVSYIRGKITNIDVLQQTLQHYEVTSNFLEKYNWASHDEVLFAAVGILPWLINRLANKNRLVVSERVFRMNVLKNANSGRLVAHALWEVSRSNGFPLNSCVILWAKWELGKVVSGYFSPPEMNGPIRIDIDNRSAFPCDKNPLLVLDCTGGWSLNEYMHLVPNWSIWLNESYPPPKGEACFLAKQKGIRVMHILWVKGVIIPPLSWLYTNGIPCCAALPEDDVSEVVVMDI